MQAPKKTEKVFGEAVLYAPNTPVPIRNNAEILKVPTKHVDKEQIRLAFAHRGFPDGYKVPSLTRVAWIAPYLYDGSGDRLLTLNHITSINLGRVYSKKKVPSCPK
ncbi:hypothetical protein [Anoxybacteroides tepidamans]|uniref:hypothetical protein n=1 Tax=Anoxybacteroides tepidamans TaxID=265948 RepID=UPI00048A1069|nr:hypothetical protein [Anoxybacillus tepidamans]